MHRALWWVLRGGRFLMSEEPLQGCGQDLQAGTGHPLLSTRVKLLALTVLKLTLTVLPVPRLSFIFRDCLIYAATFLHMPRLSYMCRDSCRGAGRICRLELGTHFSPLERERKGESEQARARVSERAR